MLLSPSAMTCPSMADIAANLNLRAPRLLVALGCGALLAAAGTVPPGHHPKSFVRTETLGISQGAALFSLVALLSGLAPSTPFIQILALAGSLTLFCFCVSSDQNSRLRNSFWLASPSRQPSEHPPRSSSSRRACKTAQALSWLVGLLLMRARLCRYVLSVALAGGALGDRRLPRSPPRHIFHLG